MVSVLVAAKLSVPLVNNVAPAEVLTSVFQVNAAPDPKVKAVPADDKVIPPLTVQVPFMVMPAVFETVNTLPVLMVNAAVLFTVKLLHAPAVVFIVTVYPLAITTSSVEAGTPDGVQVAAVFQLPVPVDVLVAALA